MINDKAILVGVDGSHASYKATWWAANYAKHAGLTLQIVCAYSLPSYAAVSFDATYTAMGDDNAAHNDAQEILAKAKAIADEQGVEASTLIVTGDPASVFVELSRNYNLIVIGNRGKGGLAGRLLGGVDFKHLYINPGDKVFDSLDAAEKAGAPLIKYGVFINTIVDFFIVAAAIFVAIKAMNKLKRTQPLEATPNIEAATPEDIVLLREIRDSLKK